MEDEDFDDEDEEEEVEDYKGGIVDCINNNDNDSSIKNNS